jgi:pyochelin synthetase
VMIDHRGAVNTITDVNRRFGIGPADRVLALSSLSFDLSVWDIFGTLAAGATIVVPEAAAARDPAHWAELVAAERVTVWDSVPALMDMLVSWAGERADAPSLDSLRLVLMSGDWIPLPLPDRIREIVPGVELISMGGATEASIWSILHPIGAVDPEWTSIPYGRPMANQRFYVLDDALEPVPVWVPGGLWIGGVGVALGYWRDEARTNASFVVHPRTGERLYRTGDLGRYRPDGTIEFLGREDFQVKIQGYRVELGEIEAALLEHTAVRDAAVIAIGEARGHKRLVASVVTDDAAVTADALQTHLRERLPDYMVPGIVRFLPALPLSSNGKVDRSALASLGAVAVPADRSHVPPRDELETRLARIWEEVLDVQPVGASDDFFELGGDSMLAVRMMVRVQQLTGRQLPLATLMRGATLEHLAALLRHDAAPAAWSSLVPIRETRTDRPACFLVHPIGGNVLCYQALAQRLGFDRSVYGLQAPGLDGREPPCTSIEELARRYIDEIRGVQGDGPYLLAGWSMGGIIACEMARQLRQDDADVGLVAVLDSRAPGTFADEREDAADDSAVILEFLHDIGGGRPAAVDRTVLAAMTDEARAAFALAAARAAGLVPADADAVHLRPLLDVFRANHRALRDYRPPLHIGAVALFRAGGREASVAGGSDIVDSTLGWHSATTEPVQLHNVPGDHYTMLAPPNVYYVAERLRRCLAAASRRWPAVQVTV